MNSQTLKEKFGTMGKALHTGLKYAGALTLAGTVIVSGVRIYKSHKNPLYHKILCHDRNGGGSDCFNGYATGFSDKPERDIYKIRDINGQTHEISRADCECDKTKSIPKSEF